MGFADRHASAHRTYANTDAGFVGLSGRYRQRDADGGGQCHSQFHDLILQLLCPLR
jgi:hypothetical protein